LTSNFIPSYSSFVHIIILARSASDEFQSTSARDSKDVDEYPSPKDKDKDEGKC